MPAKMDQPTSATDSQTAPRDANLAGVAPKAIIKNVDMSEEMQQESVDIASAALEKYNIEKDIAAQIKKEFDRRHGPTWHVVVGKNFGSYVTHGMSSLPFSTPIVPSIAPSDASVSAFCWPQRLRYHISSAVYLKISIRTFYADNDPIETKHFIYFYVGTLAILIWKS